MRFLERHPLIRVCLVTAVALAAALLLSACLARSAPPPQAEPATAQSEAEPGELAEAPEPAGEDEPAEEPRPTPQPGAIDLAVSVWHDEELVAGGSANYSVYYANYDAELDATGVLLAVALPEGATLAASTRDGETLPPSKAAGQRLEYALGTVAAGEGAEIVLQVQMPAELRPGSTVALTARIAGSAPDPDEETNYAEDVAEIPAPNVWVGVGLAEDCGPFVPGRAVSYRVSYGNAAPVEAKSVQLTGTLASGMSFRSAHLVTWEEEEEQERRQAITPQVQGSDLSFDLGTLEPGAYGEIALELDLGQGLYPDQPLTCTLRISTTSIELDEEDNWAEDVEYAQVEGPDVWIALESQSDGELGGYQSYYLYCGNGGTQDAEGISVSLTIPALLDDVTFAVEPNTFANGIATWQIGRLEAYSGGSIDVEGTIARTGQATAKATVSTTSKDVNTRNNVAEVSDEIVTIHMPAIVGPSEARVGVQPVFFGLGKPEATVKLYLAGDSAQPARLLGNTLVDEDGRWEITPTAKLPQPGWYWFTATQELNGLVSPVTGVGNYYSDDITIDTNSLTVNGERVGGIDQTIEWIGNSELTLGARIIACENPLTPTLQVRYYNAQGLMVNHKKIQPKRTGPDGYVEFDFTVPSEDEGVQWQLELGCYCREEVQTGVIGRSPGLAAPLQKGWTDIYKPGCWFGGCGNSDPEPPPKPPACPGCTPIERPKSRPKPTDPDGLVYDEAKVKAGAQMAQAIITNAWVTCARQTAEGTFEPWNALEYDQVNPQFTDVKYPDRVLRPGYFSFLVPPGSYRIRVTAPGYLPYESRTLQVLSTPITIHIPLRRALGNLRSALGLPDR
ncbi:MAG TPA: hypothetical protein PLJ35_10605 [Anaerolineae bacterium]|nr:hypothetical protein [Anaerolineae bacterium]HOQ99256.1 hypothetical protein [Anaerolineae bacterium]HPL30306.1 hypothetical protein [Anaerolineae bacterium]